MLTLRCSGDIPKARERSSKGEIIGEDLIQEHEGGMGAKAMVTTEMNRQGQDKEG